MSFTMNDQEILDLVGDLASYVGMPGGSPTSGGTLGLAAPAAAQHPFLPVQAYLSGSGDNLVLAIGGPNQRCMLPSADGTANPVTTIGLTGYAPVGKSLIPVNLNALPRIDLLVGTAELSYPSGPSGPASLGASFTYLEGNVDGSPQGFGVDQAAVVQVVVPPQVGSTPGQPSAASVQVVLPSLTFFSVPASASAMGAAGGAVPMLAAVVTAAPFNVPCIPGMAQLHASPVIDAMPAIQKALTFLGPGGAIYVPSGSYGAGTTASTQSGAIFGAINAVEFGQTIIFGGAVSFVALPTIEAAPVFVFGAGTVTIGTPKFYDLGTNEGQTTQTIPMSGVGTRYSGITVALTGTVTAGDIVIISDDDGNRMTATVASGSSSSALNLVSIGELVEGNFQSTVAFGTIALSATVSMAITDGYAVLVTGSDVVLDPILTDGWANGVQIAGADGCEIRSIRGRNIMNTGVQITNTLSGAASGGVSDCHIGSIYVNTGGGGGTCGVDIHGIVSATPVTAIKIDHIENLGFNTAIAGGAPGGPPVSGIPSTGPTGGIDACGVCVRGGGPQGIAFGIIFNSGCANGLYLDAGTADIQVSLLHASGNGDPGSGIPTGYSLACCGLSGNSGKSTVQNVAIGFMDTGASSHDHSGNGSANGIYLSYALQVHIGYALVSNRNLDGVYFDVGCASIGIAHLILQFNGKYTGGGGPYFGANATTASPTPEFISVGILDGSEETASGVLNLGSVRHLSFNDMCSPPSGSSSPPRGYFTSDGLAASAPGMTIGEAGSYEYALQVGNPSTAATAIGFSALGATSGWTLNGITPNVLSVSNVLTGSSAFHALALDDAGNLSVAGALHFSTAGVRISAGSGAPTGSAQAGSLYMNYTGAGGHVLYVYHSTGWTPII